MTVEMRDRLARVCERIARAAERAGRSPGDVTLVAVSKTLDAATVQQAVDAGVREFGENRVQEAADKIPDVQGEGLRWHLIGHLQSNKARLALSTFDVIQTVDSPELAKRLDRIAGESGRRPHVLVQLNVGGEATKSGAQEQELGRVVEAIDGAEHLQLCGLMTIPPFFQSPESARPHFRRLSRILDRLNLERPAARRLSELSMGMSHDFEVAIEEGATMVRIGTAIFGARGNK